MIKKIVEPKEIFPAIFLYENVIENCQKIIKIANKEHKDFWEDAPLAGHSYRIDESIRKTKRYDINPSANDNPIWEKIAKTIWTYGDDYGKRNHAPFSTMEAPQLLHYTPNDSFYKPHIDAGKGSPRIFSAVLYLNNVESGGETYFNKFNVSVSPKEGDLIIFPANYAYIHEARVPKSNDKFVIVTWFIPEE